MNRRDFLKSIAAAGLGGALVFHGLDKFGTEAADIVPNSKRLQAKHWGMVIDVSKFNTAEDFQAVARACHQYHNVPDIDDSKHEVKWIWQDDFEHTYRLRNSAAKSSPTQSMCRAFSSISLL
jgi:hypothetical protein